MAGPIILPSGQPKWPPTWGDGTPACCCGTGIPGCNCMFCADCAWDAPTKVSLSLNTNWQAYRPPQGFGQPGTGWWYVNPNGTYILDPATYQNPGCTVLNIQDQGGCAGPWGMILTGPAGRGQEPVANLGRFQWLGIRFGRTVVNGNVFGVELLGNCGGVAHAVYGTFTANVVTRDCFCPANGLTLTIQGIDCSRSYTGNLTAGAQIQGGGFSFAAGTFTVSFFH